MKCRHTGFKFFLSYNPNHDVSPKVVCCKFRTSFEEYKEHSGYWGIQWGSFFGGGCHGEIDFLSDLLNLTGLSVQPILRSECLSLGSLVCKERTDLDTLTRVKADLKLGLGHAPPDRTTSLAAALGIAPNQEGLDVRTGAVLAGHVVHLEYLS